MDGNFDENCQKSMVQWIGNLKKPLFKIRETHGIE